MFEIHLGIPRNGRSVEQAGEKASKWFRNKSRRKLRRQIGKAMVLSFMGKEIREQQKRF